MTAITHFDCPSVAQLPADLKASSTSSCTSTLILISRFVIETDNSAPLHRISWSPWKPENILDHEKFTFPDNILFFLDWTNHQRHTQDKKSFNKSKGQKNCSLKIRNSLSLSLVFSRNNSNWTVCENHKSGTCWDEWEILLKRVP